MPSIMPIPLPTYQLQGISRRQLEEHYKLCVVDVNKKSLIRQLLLTVDRSDANPEYSPFRELKVEESYVCDSMRLHERYFTNLGGPGGRPTGPLLDQIVRDFGSCENWQYDFISIGRAARGWAVLAWDDDDKRLFNGLSDTHNHGPIWCAVPLLVLDVYEHAYFIDYGANRDGYIAAFMCNINWAEVERRFAMTLPQPLPEPLPVPGPLGPGLGSTGPTRSSVKQLPYPYNLRPRWPV